jgi:hypothetical protein
MSLTHLITDVENALVTSVLTSDEFESSVVTVIMDGNVDDHIIDTVTESDSFRTAVEDIIDDAIYRKVEKEVNSQIEDADISRLVGQALPDDDSITEMVTTHTGFAQAVKHEVDYHIQKEFVVRNRTEAELWLAIDRLTQENENLVRALDLLARPPWYTRLYHRLLNLATRAGIE